MKKIVAINLSIILVLQCFGCVATPKIYTESNEAKYVSALPLDQLKNTLNDEVTVYALKSDPGENINPITTQTVEANFLFHLMYQPLFSFANGEYIMNLAESVEKQGNSVFVVKLKSDLLWSDSVPITAEDVVFTYQLIQKEKNSWAYSHLIYPEGEVTVKGLDSHTIQFIFPSSHANGMAMLANILILPQHVFQFYNETYTIENCIWARKQVGCGPYILQEYALNRYYLFRRNPQFSENVPFETNYLIVYNSGNTREAVSDISEDKIDKTIIPSWDLRILRKKAGKKLEQSEIGMKEISVNQLRYLGINGERIKDYRLREAIFYSLNRQLVNESGFIEPQYYHSEFSFIPQSNDYYNPNTSSLYTWNLDEAEELLEEFDLDSFSLTLGYCSDDDSAAAQAATIKDLLALSNIRISLKKVKIRSELYQYDLFLDDLPCEADPDLYSKYFISQSKQNIFNYYNPTIEQLFHEGRLQNNVDRRKEIYNTLQTQIIEDAYIYPLCTYSSIFLFRTN